MPTTISARDFNQATSAAQKAAREGPVFITDRGRPAYVLLSIADYERLALDRPSLVDLLSAPGTEDLEFDPPRLDLQLRPADFG